MKYFDLRRKIKIKINFTDFWPGFNVTNNYFFNLLKEYYNVELSEDPEFIIFSCFGNEYKNYKCIRIYFSGENIRPDFSICDFAITSDYNTDIRHLRLPLYALYINLYKSMPKLLKTMSEKQAKKIWRSKSKFCCMVVSNPVAKKRVEFFENLSKYKIVDSGGVVMNNIGGPVKDKMNFIKDYRFVIAFENSSYPGYTTEKLLEPLIVNSIPLYWGNSLVNNDFNPSCFLHLDNNKLEEDFINEIISIDSNEEIAISMLMQSKFKDSKIPEYIKKEKVFLFLKNIINTQKKIIPIAIKNESFSI